MPKVIDLSTATSMDDGDYLIMEESSGGTKKITRANALASAHGTIVSAVSGTGVVPNDTNTSVCSITLTRGVWLIQAQVRLDRSGGTFQMYAGISQYSTSAEVDGGGFVQESVIAPATSISVNMSRIVNVTASSKQYYLVVWHDAGADRSLASSGRQTLMTAVKIA